MNSTSIDIQNVTLGHSNQELATKARVRIQQAINEGRENAGSVIKKVRDTRIQDKIVKAQALKFHIDQGAIRLGAETESIHPHAMHQITERAQIPWAYVNSLQSKGVSQLWATDLLVHNLNELYRNDTGKYLLRSVNNEVRGFLSDRYRRMDTLPLIQSFVEACDHVGALPYRGYVSDTRFAIQAIIPVVREPIPNEVLAYGVNFEDSSFGNGPTQVSVFVLRGVCLNGMIAEKAIRQIHLGRQTTEDIAYEADTYEADSKALSLKIRDVVKGYLSEDTLNAMEDNVRVAAAAKLDPDKTEALLKKLVSKAEATAIINRFNEPDVEMLPPGNNKWRLANAISWIAGESESPERTIELQKAAGNVLKG